MQLSIKELFDDAQCVLIGHVMVANWHLEQATAVLEKRELAEERIPNDSDRGFFLDWILDCMENSPGIRELSNTVGEVTARNILLARVPTIYTYMRKALGK